MGAVAVTATGTSPAGAATGDALVAGSTANTANNPTGLRVDNPAAPYGFGVSDGAIESFPNNGTIAAHAGPKFGTALAGTGVGPSKTGVRGYANGSFGVGGHFTGSGNNTIGVYAWGVSSTDVTQGVGLKALGGRANLNLAPQGDPHEEEFWNPEAGDVVCDSTGNLYFATYGGAGVKYVRLAGPTSAGAFHAINPTRAEDTRVAGRGGALGAQQTRVADLAVNLGGGALVPYKATAAVVNVTVTGTSGSGFLTLWPYGEPKPTASTINWSGSGQTIANGATIALGSAQRMNVYCGGSGGPSTDYLIDVTGYYR